MASGELAFRQALANALLTPEGGLGAALAGRSGGNISDVGDSIMAGGFAGMGIPRRATLKSGGKYYSGGSYAVGGKRTDEILSAQIPLAVQNRAQRILFNGGTNDIAQLGATAGILAARTNLIAIVAAIRAAGKSPVSVGMLPANNGAQVAHAELEKWRQLWCLRNGVPHAHVWPVMANADGTYKSGYNFDVLHPNSVGADVAATELIARLENTQAGTLFRELVDLPVGSLIPLPNAVSFGGVGAALPTGYSASGSGATYSVEAPVDGSFGNWLVATYTSAVSAVGFTGTPKSISVLGWSIGDRLAIGFRMKTVAAGEQTLRPRITLGGSLGMDYGSATAGGGIQSQIFDDWSGAAGEDYNVYYEGTITSGTTMNFNVLATTTGATTQKLMIQRPIIYNLTKNALA